MRKLYRIEEGKMLCGVCGGLAEYFEIDVTIVRLATVLISLCNGIGLLMYIAGAILMPIKPEY